MKDNLSFVQWLAQKYIEDQSEIKNLNWSLEHQADRVKELIDKNIELAEKCKEHEGAMDKLVNYIAENMDVCPHGTTCKQNKGFEGDCFLCWKKWAYSKD